MKTMVAAKMALFAIIALLSPSGISAAKMLLASSETPVTQVLNMLRKMESTGNSDMANEKMIMDTYTTWFQDTVKQTGFDITTATAAAEKLDAQAKKSSADAVAHGNKYSELNQEVEEYSANKEAAEKQRAAENAEYATSQQDLSESVDALERAIDQLKAQNYDRKQAQALLQRMASTEKGMPRVLAAYLQISASDESSNHGAPAVAAYEFQSGGIVEVLQGLLKKFKQELAETESEEVNRQHAFELETLHLSNVIADTSEEAQANKAMASKAESAAVNANSNLQKTQASLQESQALLADMKVQFKAKKAQFEANQKLRREELATIAKVIEIIGSADVKASYAKHQPNTNLLQATTLLQTVSSKARVVLRNRVATFLRNRAAVLSSKVLGSFADQVAANPFDKVIKMIEDLVAKLKEEANSEADHKAWCDEELVSNKKKRKAKTTSVNMLTADVEALTAKIDTLGREIATLLEEQQALGASMQQSTKERTAEKAENEATIADAAAGSAAVKQALVILREFYGAQASLVQQAPEMAAYKGMGDSNSGVMGMLEVIQADFERLEAETKASENTAADAHAKFMSEATSAKESKHKDTVAKKLEKDAAEFDRGRKQKELAAVSSELAEANKYFETLRPSCLQVHVSYEERVRRRKDEIAALKQAYEILDQKQL